MHALLIAIALALATPALAEDGGPSVPLLRLYAQHMATTWMCRNDIGVSSYQLARDLFINGLLHYGMDRAEAITDVDAYDKKFRNDPRTLPKGAGNAQRCLDIASEELYNINLERVKLDKVLGLK